VNNHDQTKLEIAAAADEIADERDSIYTTDISTAISAAFRQFAEEVRNRTTRGGRRD